MLPGNLYRFLKDSTLYNRNPRKPWNHWDCSPRSVGTKSWNPIGRSAKQEARRRCRIFFEHGLRDYKEGRNFPAKSCVSRLSPYLHQGQISPNQAWYGAQAKHSGKNLDHFLSELGWREFSYSLLYHFPDLPSRNLQGRFDAFPWKEDSRLLERWKRGQTGYRLLMPECVNYGKLGTSTTVCA